MKKILLVCGFAALLSACSDDSNMQQTETAQPTAPVVTVSSDPIPTWVSEPNKTTAPLGEAAINGQKYTATNFCKPHACGNDFMISLSAPDQETMSLVVSVADVDGAITEPSKYATYWLIGRPGHQVQTELVKLLNQDPNWN